MIKRTFTSDSYDHAFSEHAIKTPSFPQNLIKQFNDTQAPLFLSKHGVLLLSFINLVAVMGLLIFVINQFQGLHQQMDEGRSKLLKLEGLIKALQELPHKTIEEASTAPGVRPQSQHESQLTINDLNIKYLGLIHTGNSFKALLELDDVRTFFNKGQMIEGVWLIKSFDHSQMILESIKGQQTTILLEQ